MRLSALEGRSGVRERDSFLLSAPFSLLPPPLTLRVIFLGEDGVSEAEAAGVVGMDSSSFFISASVVTDGDGAGEKSPEGDKEMGLT